MRSASVPSTSSHSSRWYFAFAIPHRSGQTIAAWSPAATPSFVWPSTMRAFGLARETSARSPTTSPAPTAGPVIAETIGVGQREHVVDEVAGLVEDAQASIGVVGDREHEVEVAAGAERAVGAADEDGARLLVLPDRLPDPRELAVLRLAHGVEPPGRAKRQPQDPRLRPIEVERRELRLVRVRRHDADPTARRYARPAARAGSSVGRAADF